MQISIRPLIKGKILIEVEKGTDLVEDQEVCGRLGDLAVLTLLLHDDAAESRAQGQRGIA